MHSSVYAQQLMPSVPFIARQEAFTCEHCGCAVLPLMHGGYRNHCPHCLYSKHVDDQGPGDRASTCGRLMEPMELRQHSKKGWTVIHRCLSCGKLQPNRTAEDDEIIEWMESKASSL